MPNVIPFSGATPAGGGALIPDAQGEILTNALLRQSGAVNLVGDARTTAARREIFPIWLGNPTAAFVGEGATKPATGAEFGSGQVNVKKIATTVIFTEEMVEDVQGGDLNVLVDSGIRSAIGDVIDQHVTGKAAGADQATNFDNMLRSTTQAVEFVQASGDALRKAISAAMGLLEANGYVNQANMRLLLGPGTPQHIRDARSASDATKELYDTDPVYGLQTHYSSNLNNVATPALGAVVGYLVYAPNLHMRIRKDVVVKASSEATVFDGTANRNMFQENLTALVYETRLGYFAHDLNRSVVKLTNAA